MSAIDFPANPGSLTPPNYWTAASGVQYRWDNEKWVSTGGSATYIGMGGTGANFVTGDIKFSDTKGVKFGAADDLAIYHDGTNNYIDFDTGELRLSVAGTSKMTLDSSGAATFAGTAKFGSTVSCGSSDFSGPYTYIASNEIGLNTNSSTSKFKVASDGSITAAGPLTIYDAAAVSATDSSFTIRDPYNIADVATIDGAGAATFAGNLDIGSRDTAASDKSGAVLVNDGTFLLQKVATDSDAAAFLKFGRGKETGGGAGEGVKCQILANGSITAADKIKVGTYNAGSTNPTTNAFEGYNNSAVNATYFAQNNSSDADATLWFGYNSSDNITSQIKNDGSATFAGNIGINVTPGDWGSSNNSGLQVHATTNSYLTLTNTTTGSAAATDGVSIITSGNDAYFINRESTGSFYFETNGSPRLAIKDDGKIGIGTTGPSSYLDVRFAGRQGISIGSTNGSGAWIGLDGAGNGDFAGGDYAYMEHLGTGDARPGDLPFFVGNASNGSSERFRIRATGGVTFNGDTADANALDDYEEGTFTPTLTDYNGVAVVSPAYDSGNYVKIGNIVTVTYYSSSLSISNSGNSSAKIGNLPFTCWNSTGHYPVAAFTHTTCFTGTAGSAHGNIQNGYMSSGSGNLYPMNVTSLSAAQWSTSGYLMFSVTYRTA